MKITKNKLKKLIKEELSSVLSEVEPTVRSGMAIFGSLLAARRESPENFKKVAEAIFNNRRDTRELIKYVLSNAQSKDALEIFDMITDSKKVGNKEVKIVTEAAKEVIDQAIRRGDDTIVRGFTTAVNRRQNALNNILNIAAKKFKSEITDVETFTKIASKDPQMAAKLRNTLGKYLTKDSTKFANKFMGQLGKVIARIPGMAAISGAAAAGGGIMSGPVLAFLTTVYLGVDAIAEGGLYLQKMYNELGKTVIQGPLSDKEKEKRFRDLSRPLRPGKGALKQENKRSNMQKVKIKL